MSNNISFINVGGNNYVIVRIPSNSELKKFLGYDVNSFDFNGTITDRKITFNMHKNPIHHRYGGYLENTYPQDNYMDKYGDYYIGFSNYGYPRNYISKSNIGQYRVMVYDVDYTMTLVRPMIKYKE